MESTGANELFLGCQLASAVFDFAKTYTAPDCQLHGCAEMDAWHTELSQ